MIEKLNNVIKFNNPPKIISGFSVVGPKEKGSVFAPYFGEITKDDHFGEKTYEKAERHFLRKAIEGAIHNAGLKTTDMDFLISGDLLDQIISSSFVARQLGTTFIGAFGACSTMALSICIGSIFVTGGFAKYVACASSSHFSTAERQFRFPLELGSQRPPTSQWTVTAAGSSVVSNVGKGHFVTHIMIGKVMDYGIKDVNNMGCAMAPAAADTLERLFKDTKTKPADYDAIFSGDLGKLGGEVLLDLLEEKGYKNIDNYRDCGQLFFTNKQKAFMGASGCGCSASFLNSYILNKITNGTYKKVIFMATGALLSPLSAQQGESIPGIAHAIVIEKGF